MSNSASKAYVATSKLHAQKRSYVLERAHREAPVSWILARAVLYRGEFTTKQKRNRPERGRVIEWALREGYLREHDGPDVLPDTSGPPDVKLLLEKMEEILGILKKPGMAALALRGDEEAYLQAIAEDEPPRAGGWDAIDELIAKAERKSAVGAQ